jgi:hypothetical protein
VPNQPKTKFARYTHLDLLNIPVLKLDDLTRGHVDQVIVVGPVCLLVTATSLAERVPFENTFGGEQLQRPLGD